MHIIVLVSAYEFIQYFPSIIVLGIRYLTITPKLNAESYITYIHRNN